MTGQDRAGRGLGCTPQYISGLTRLGGDGGSSDSSLSLYLDILAAGRLFLETREVEGDTRKYSCDSVMVLCGVGAVLEKQPGCGEVEGCDLESWSKCASGLSEWVA